MTEKQFAKLVSWLRSEHSIKKNSVVLVLPGDDKENEGWHIDKFLGYDELRLYSARHFIKTKKYKYKTLTKDSYDKVETILDKIYIRVSKENIMKGYKEHNV